MWSLPPDRRMLAAITVNIRKTFMMSEASAVDFRETLKIRWHYLGCCTALYIMISKASWYKVVILSHFPFNRCVCLCVSSCACEGSCVNMWFICSHVYQPCVIWTHLMLLPSSKSPRSPKLFLPKIWPKVLHMRDSYLSAYNRWNISLIAQILHETSVKL